jgi:hypothetical protein
LEDKALLNGNQSSEDNSVSVLHVDNSLLKWKGDLRQLGSKLTALVCLKSMLLRPCIGVRVRRPEKQHGERNWITLEIHDAT